MSEVSEHLQGPWVAIMLNAAGRGTRIVEDAVAIRVATGPGIVDPLALPGQALNDDVLYEISTFWDTAEVLRRWEQAKAVATGLNASAEAVTTRG